MRAGKSWAFLEPYGQPVFVTDITDRDGEVGEKFFEEWAARKGWAHGPDEDTPGLVDRMEDFDSDAFVASRVHPLVRHLYEHTVATEFIADRPKWKPAGWILHGLYFQLVSRWMKQLQAPVWTARFPTDIRSRVSPLRRTPGSPILHRAWARTFETWDDPPDDEPGPGPHDSKIFYTAAVSVPEQQGPRGSQRYLSAVLPLWHSTLTVVFQPANLPRGGFSIDTIAEGSYLAGTYIVVPGRSRYSMFPAFGVRDQIHLHPRRDENGEYLDGRHRTWIGPLEAYTIPYRIRPYRGAASAQAEVAAADVPPQATAGAAPGTSAQPAAKARDAAIPSKVDVVVVGAGPAGIAAALALRRRGVGVLLVEASDTVGGRAYTTRDAEGRGHGHGVHGWWQGYVNFERLMKDSGIDPEDAVRPALLGGLLTSPQRMTDIRDVAVQLPSPFHLLEAMRDLRQFTFADYVSMARLAVHALAFDHVLDYAGYDSMTLAEFAEKCGVSERVCNLFLKPFAVSFDYAPAEVVSASSVLSALQLYVLPSATSMRPHWSRGLEHERIFGPLVDHFRDIGGVFAPRTRLESVKIAAGRVTGAVLAPGGGGDGTETLLTVPLAAVPADGYAEFAEPAGGKLWVGRHGGQILAFRSVCPHKDLPVVEWTGSEFTCNAHGSSFAGDGSRKSGPTPSGLLGLACQVIGQDVHIQGSRTAAHEVECERVIVATTLPAAAAILGASDGVPEELRSRLAALRTTPVVVVRLWFVPDAPFPRDRETVLYPDGNLVDIAFCLNALGQARDEDSLVLEVHCAASGAKAHWANETDETIVNAACADLADMAPGLTKAHLLPGRAPEVQKHGDFPLFAPGDAPKRPRAETGVDGLLLAGDWTRADSAVWMMERAVVSGLRAANVILDAKNLLQAEVLPIPGGGRLLDASRAVARAIRRVLGTGSD